MMPQQCDVAVVGAGAGGLACALRLAVQGKNVHVYEVMDGPGGKIGHHTHQGVSFDTGPSLLTMRAHLDELFEVCGTRLEDEIELIQHAPGFRYLWPDGTQFDVHHELAHTRESVSQSFGDGALAQFDSFMAYSKQIWEAALPNFVEGEAPSFGSILKLGMTKLREVSKIDPFRSMQQGIERHIKEPHLRDVMMRYATYNGSNALSAPATLNCIAWVEMGLGGWGVKGGMSALPAALERVGKHVGVTFHYGSCVKRVKVKGGRAVGLIVEDDQGETHHVSTARVVINADVTHLKEMLLAPGVDHGLGKGLQPSMSGWTGVLRTRAAQTKRAPHTVLFPRNYDQEFIDIFEHDRPPNTPTVYMCDQAQSHGRPGWDDDTVPIFVMANAPCEPERDAGNHDEAYWAVYKERVTTRLKEHGLMDEGDAFVWERSPTQLAAQFPGSRGAIYGAASNTQTAAFKRPPNRLKAIAGVYLASGSAHPGGGVPLCVLSGKAAAKHVMDDERA